MFREIAGVIGLDENVGIGDEFAEGRGVAARSSSRACCDYTPTINRAFGAGLVGKEASVRTGAAGARF